MKPTFEPGIYKGRVTSWGLSKSKTKSTNQFVMRFVILGKVDQSDPESSLIPCSQLERTLYRPITEKTADWLVDDLQAIFGYDRQTFAGLDSSQRDAFNFLDFETTFRCEHETYEGDLKERWNFDRGAPEIDPLDQKEIATLDALFGKAFKKKGKATAPVAPADDGNSKAPIAQKAKPVGEEIPF